MLKLNRLPHRFILVTTGTRTSGPFQPSSRSDLAIPRGWIGSWVMRMKWIHKDWWKSWMLYIIILKIHEYQPGFYFCGLFPGCWSLRRRNSAIFFDTDPFWSFFVGRTQFVISESFRVRWFDSFHPTVIIDCHPQTTEATKCQKLSNWPSYATCKTYLKSFIKVTQATSWK